MMHVAWKCETCHTGEILELTDGTWSVEEFASRIQQRHRDLAKTRLKLHQEKPIIAMVLHPGKVWAEGDTVTASIKPTSEWETFSLWHT
jgi:hypothetical protein